MEFSESGGRFLDQADDLDAGAIGKSGKKQQTNGGGEYTDYTEMDELVRRIRDGEALHTSVTHIAGKCAKDGVPKHFCIDMIRSAFVAAGQVVGKMRFTA